MKGSPNIVVGLNEAAILGAIAAGEATERQKQLWYSGQLADPSIRQTIACEPRYLASVAQFPERFGEPLVAAAAMAIEGEALVPLQVAEMELVTADNVRQLFPDTPACDA